MMARAVLPRAVLLAAVLAAAASCVPGGTAFVKSAPPPELQSPTVPSQGPLLESLTPGRALLVDGSRLVKGLPGFGRNALPALAGMYAYIPAGQKTIQGEPDTILQVSVWFTREPLVYSAEWTTPAGGLKPCPTLPAGISLLGTFKPDEGTTLWALGAAGYTLFVGVPAALANPCRFVSVLAERFLFFQRYAERPEDTSFPAILDIER